jgi:hypothetical protein
MFRVNWKAMVFCSCFFIVIAPTPQLAAGLPPGNNALDFDGENDYLEVLDPISLTGPFTIEAWVFVRGGAGGRICANSSGITGYDFDIAGGSSGMSLRFGIFNQNQIKVNFDAYVGSWTHVAVSGIGEIGKTVRLYINGELTETAVVDETLAASSTNLHIGCLTNGMYFFDGAIDELRIWRTELDQPTIQTYMNAIVETGHPVYNFLEGYWRFDEGTGQIAASEVVGSQLDARLGVGAGDDTADPIWITSGVTPTERCSFGTVKAMYAD